MRRPLFQPLLRLLPVCLALAAPPAPAQSLLDNYTRVQAITNDVTVYVVEVLQSCITFRAHGEPQAKARMESYLKRNDAVIERVEAWGREVTKQLVAQGQGGLLEKRTYEIGLNAVGGASQRARKELNSAKDPVAACQAKFADIDAGTYDLGRNTELLAIIGKGN